MIDRATLSQHFGDVRGTSTALCKPLAAEDYRIQSMADVSPPWWNLGHTTWFFAKNILQPRTGYCFPDGFEFALNSYYEVHGERVRRSERGLLTRPTTDDIYHFRQQVDTALLDLLDRAHDDQWQELAFLVTTGIHHEQQHQELLLTEIKHILSRNASELRAPYHPGDERSRATGQVVPLTPVAFEGGLHEFGNLEGGWCWDNELPVHRAWIEPFALSQRLVTNGEFLEFLEGGGYDTPLLWLANGWEAVQQEHWRSPLYWEKGPDGWRQWTLGGMEPLRPDEPVTHVSFYEADAYATWRGQQDAAWRGARLPTEHEWELAARQGGFCLEGANLLDRALYRPMPHTRNGSVGQLAGDLWEWTSSHYEPYPGYEPFAGELMEYNGKFMDNQRVLRGGSCVTPASHLRLSYRNFWAASTRFQFTGIRLARSL